jgi:putative methyltransferase
VCGAPHSLRLRHHMLILLAPFAENIPRYARINTNLTTPSDLIAYLQSPSGGSFILLTPTPVTPSSPSPYPKTIDLPLKSFHLSPDLPNILIFPLSSTSFITNNAAYVDGRIILQDLASCMPALVLLGDPEKRAAEGGGEGGEGVVDGWDGVGEVIDATSAPGNKTTHLSMLMGNKGKVHAFELSYVFPFLPPAFCPLPFPSLPSFVPDRFPLLLCLRFASRPHRFQILKKMVKTAGCKNVSLGPGEEGTRRDFLETDPTSEEWSRVKYIMLDPSCSGSGIVNRLDVSGSCKLRLWLRADQGEHIGRREDC